MKLFPPQEAVIQNGYIDACEHTLLNMATGSGKTFLSEIAVKKVVGSGYKAVYITPLRALAKQQCGDWKKKFAGCEVGVFTGETVQRSKTRSAYSKSQILIMTPERFDACLRNWRTHWSWIPDVSLVVIDEFHILGQGRRGPRLEGAITRMIRLNPFARLIGLSATMPNYSELASWLRGKAYHSSWRQIEINKKIVRFSSAKDKPGIALEQVKDCIARGGQSIVFCNSRARVQQLTDFFREHGIPAASHHAGLLSEVRSEHEAGFLSGQYKAMVATSTVEMGLNLPARQVIIYDSYSYTDIGFTALPVWSYIQRMGRAGRPGMDPSSDCILLLPKWAGDADRYLSEDCEPVVSQLASRQAMMEQILIDVSAGYSRTRAEVTQGFLPLTLYHKQHSDANIGGIMNDLVLSGLLMESSNGEKNRDPHEATLKVGMLGRMAVKLMLAAETVTLIGSAKKGFDRLYVFDLLLIACMSEDCRPLLQTNYEEMDTLCEIVQPLPSSLLDLTMERLREKLPEAPNTLRSLAAIKMAAICHCITEGLSLEEIADRFYVYESDIQMLRENAVRLLTGISAVSTAIDRSELTEDALAEKKEDICSMSNVSSMLSNMLLYGINSSSAALTQLKGVGGKTAKKLADNGYSTLDALRSARADELSAISGIGKKLAGSIVEQAGKAKAFPIYAENAAAVCGGIREVRTSIDPYRLRRSLELSVKGKDGGRFCITGGREDHIVVIRNGEMRCDCLDYQKNQWQCKHILCAKRTLGDAETTKMIKKIKENKNDSIREALPGLWFSMNPAGGR